jgi:CRP-like cAMP-binding protein
MIRFRKYLQENFDFSNREFEDISEFAEPAMLKKQEYFLKKGKVCHKLAFIESGVLRFCMDRDGEDITCYFVYENCFAGDPDSFFTHQPSDKTMQALTDCELINISRTGLERILNVCPRFKDIMTGIDRKVMMDLMTQREFLIQSDAATKYKKFIELYPHILQRVPLGYIASFLGITQQSLSRLRNQIS